MKVRLCPLLVPVLLSSFASPATFAAPAIARSASPAFSFLDDPLEARWSYRVHLDGTARGAGGASWLLGQDERNGVVLSLSDDGNLSRVQGVLSRVERGQKTELSRFALPFAYGELSLVRVGRTLQVLWNGERVAQVQTDIAGTRFGSRAQGSWKLSGEQMQPTEPVVLRDDFMRASGPNEPEADSVWQTQGSWKTSGTLGPLADASLSPNPFVFRAQGQGLHRALAGKWFWNDYSVAASVRAVPSDEDDGKSPLIAGVEAFAAPGGGSIWADVNFRTGVARIVQELPNGVAFEGAGQTSLRKPLRLRRMFLAYRATTQRVLAESVPFDASLNQWHRLRLEPKDGLVRLFFDGHEVARAKTVLAQGQVGLRASLGTSGYVDFDDVRVGEPQGDQAVWGEGQLPDRLVKDRLMKNWASAASAWKRSPGGIWWHTGDFWKDANVSATLPALKEGQGFRFYLFADSREPSKAALVATVERKNGKVELSAPSTSPMAARPIEQRLVSLTPSASNTLTLHLTAFETDARTGSIQWNGQKVLPLVASPGNGTKIGIEPLRNGQPCAPAGLQKLTLQAPTFEREGKAVIGVNITPVSPGIAAMMGLPDATGVVIDHVDEGSPAQKAGFMNGDVVRNANGVRVMDVATMQAAVGSVQAPTPVALEILRVAPDPSGLDLANCQATTSNQLDYAFTGAPTDWKSARGTWEVAERWTCSPQWSFFSGSSDEFPLLWSRFALAGDWTLEAYIATPMDLTRGERSPSDLNVSVGDGNALSSGYSFGFGAQGRSANLIWRGNEIVKQSPFEMPPTSGDTHQDWFYVRLERRRTPGGVRFTWSVNGVPLGTYEDAKALQNADRLAFWTKNGAISIARIRVWHAGLKDVPLAPRPSVSQTPSLTNVLGQWTPRDPGPLASAQLTLLNAPKDPTLQIENPRDGGDWTTYLSRAPFDPAQKNGILLFDYRVPPSVKLNLYALVAGQWRGIAWTGGTPAPDANAPMLGSIENVLADNAWHTARFDLASALARSGLQGQMVDALAFAAPARDYLRQGLGGNPRGAKFWVRRLQTQPTSLARPVSARAN